jgi:UDP-2,3-diacylglucosamine hydrolase
MKAYFVSDLHLKNPDDPSTKVFESFLTKLIHSAHEHDGNTPTHLFLVGDVFDLWIGSHEYFRKKFATVVNLISELVHAGVAVHFFEGNHDLHLEKFWHEGLGVHVHSDHEFFQLEGLTIRVEHGDLINPDDKGYLFLRKLLRTETVKQLSLNLPSVLVTYIGERASRASRNYTSTAKELPEDKIRILIRNHAERMFAEKPYDLLITGHVHVKDDVVFEVSGKTVRSVNLGSWFDGPKAFLLSRSQGEFIELK